MRLLFAQHFVGQYKKLSQRLRLKVDKQLSLLASNLRHPSLRAKKYDEDNIVFLRSIQFKFQPVHIWEPKTRADALVFELTAPLREPLTPYGDGILSIT